MKALFLLFVTLMMAMTGCERSAPTASSTNSTATGTVDAASAPGATNQVYDVKGIVRNVDLLNKTALIQHEKIPNYMPAMTMSFDVKDTNELTGLNAGDVVAFKLIARGDEEAWIEQVRKVGQTNITVPETRSFRRVRDVEPLEIGDAIPDYTFTNELGKAVRLTDYKGQALAITFIFTRCLYPNFCPRMSKNFQEIYKQLNAAGAAAATNWHLFSLSFDPEFDTPERLERYARQYKYDPQRWNFLTGAMIDVDAITEQFGLGFSWRNATIDHTLRTVVVDANGKVHKVWIGNEWNPREVADEIMKAARVGPKIDQARPHPDPLPQERGAP